MLIVCWVMLAYIVAGDGRWWSLFDNILLNDLPWPLLGVAICITLYYIIIYVTIVLYLHMYLLSTLFDTRKFDTYHKCEERIILPFFINRLKTYNNRDFNIKMCVIIINYIRYICIYWKSFISYAIKCLTIKHVIYINGKACQNVYQTWVATSTFK